MRQSQLLTKTRKEAPSDEVSKNAQLLIQGGFIHKEMAGVYALLPLGVRVIKNIEEIIRQEMNAVGGQEIQMTALQDPEPWEKSGRWSNEVMDVWFKTELQSGGSLGLAPTHEEPLTKLLTNHINSYKDLPVYPYQFQTKFRNELRAKSGIMRGREFLMKDLYSFSLNEEQHNDFYEEMKVAYTNVFNRLGLGDITYLTYASGGSFSPFSHEFQTLTDAGEDIIHICNQCKVAVNEEIIETHNTCPECDANDLQKEKAVEVGNIFSLGTKFSDALSLTYTDSDGAHKKVVMGSYGIGLGRVMGTVVETLSDDNGIVWPEEIAPFRVHLISLGQNEEAEKLYDELTSRGVEVLYDDRDCSAGEKFSDSDLLGIPCRVVISAKTLEKDALEVKRRDSSDAEFIKDTELFNRLKA